MYHEQDEIVFTSRSMVKTKRIFEREDSGSLSCPALSSHWWTGHPTQSHSIHDAEVFSIGFLLSVLLPGVVGKCFLSSLISQCCHQSLLRHYWTWQSRPSGLCKDFSSSPVTNWSEQQTWGPFLSELGNQLCLTLCDPYGL